MAAKDATSRDHPGAVLDALSEPQLERLYAGLVKLAAMDGSVLAALVDHVLAGTSSSRASNSSRVVWKALAGV